MQYGILKKAVLISSLLIVFISSSCKKDRNEPDPLPNGPLKKTVLLYAVASNNLNENILSDKSEILKAAESLNLEGVSMLVYQVTLDHSVPPTLLELTKEKDGSPKFEILKEYDRKLYSTDPERLSQVVEDVANLRKADSYGLIFWGHGSGFDPEFSGHATRSGDEFSSLVVPIHKAFGYDVDYDKDSGHKDWMDIDEMADALLDGMFDYIWFDICYMSNIETIYQLRNKCDYYIGYTTEVGENGMPYDRTLPYLLGLTGDLKDAARIFFEYYQKGEDPAGFDVATIALFDMTKIEGVADACRRIYSGSRDVDSAGLLNYTRSKVGPFYDLGQFSRKKMQAKDNPEEMKEFDEAMAQFVVWKAATEKDFNIPPLPIPADDYSGISCHLYKSDANDKKTQYYRSLDWFKRVY